MHDNIFYEPRVPFLSWILSCIDHKQCSEWSKLLLQYAFLAPTLLRNLCHSLHNYNLFCTLSCDLKHAAWKTLIFLDSLFGNVAHTCHSHTPWCSFSHGVYVPFERERIHHILCKSAVIQFVTFLLIQWNDSVKVRRSLRSHQSHRHFQCPHWFQNWRMADPVWLVVMHMNMPLTLVQFLVCPHHCQPNQQYQSRLGAKLVASHRDWNGMAPPRDVFLDQNMSQAAHQRVE